MEIAFQEYEIGTSPPELLHEAAQIELETGRPPRVSKNIRGHTQEMETYVGLLIQEIINRSGSGTFIFTNAGCSNDNLYQMNGYPHHVGVQMKTTTKQIKVKGYLCWAFNHVFGERYDGSVMIFRCIQDQKMWIIPYRELSKHYSGNYQVLQIYDGPKSKTIWKDYRVTMDMLVPTLMKYFQMAPRNELVNMKDYDHAMTPTSPTVQREVKTRKRLDGILNYKVPVLTSLPYDIIWQGLKIQENPAIENCGSNSTLGLTVNTYKSYSGHRYTQADFDILLIHCSDKYEKYFYFIPSHILIKRSILRTATSPGKSCCMVYPPGIPKGNPRDEWANDYIYEYQESELEIKLINMCKSWELLK